MAAVFRAAFFVVAFSCCALAALTAAHRLFVAAMILRGYEHVLFDQHQVLGPTGIAYDQYDNSLWLSDTPTDIVAEYSLGGRLLQEFHTGNAGNSALAFDPTDRSLWMITGGLPGSTGNIPSNECLPGFPGACLEQWSTDGRLLQIGNVLSLPNRFAAGEIAESPIPEPGTTLLFGSGFLVLAGFLRRKSPR